MSEIKLVPAATLTQDASWMFLPMAAIPPSIGFDYERATKGFYARVSIANAIIEDVLLEENEENWDNFFQLNFPSGLSIDYKLDEPFPMPLSVTVEAHGAGRSFETPEAARDLTQVFGQGAGAITKILSKTEERYRHRSGDEKGGIAMRFQDPADYYRLYLWLVDILALHHRTTADPRRVLDMWLRWWQWHEREQNHEFDEMYGTGNSRFVYREEVDYYRQLVAENRKAIQAVRREIAAS